MPSPIKLGEWTPDQADRSNAALEAKGVISIGGNYAPLKDLEDYNGSDAATATTCKGIIGVYDSSLNGQIFMGDSTYLYTMVSRVATDVSKSGNYTIGDDDWWAFTQYGDYVIAVANGTAPQVYQMGVSSAFADLGGSPPSNATTVARVNDFVWMGKDFTVYWSAFNNIASWTPSASTQAGTQDLDQSQGRIQTIIGGDYAAVFQERAIRRAVYVGPPVIWDFGQDAVETRRGAIAPFAAAKYGRSIFFVADDGFYVFDGQSSQSIGAGKVDDYFQRNVNYGYRHRICVGIDSIGKQVAFAYPKGAATEISEVLFYSLSDGRWTREELALDILGDAPVEAYTVDNFHLYETSDDLDTSNLDSVNIDSNVFDEKRRLLMGVRQSNQRVATFTGSARQGIVETAEFEIAPAERSFISEIWPIGNFQAANISASIGRRVLPGGSVSYTNGTTMNSVGFCPQRTTGRFVRGRLQVAAGGTWTRLEGLLATAQPAGDR